MAKSSILREFFRFMREEKKWWLLPLLIIGIIIGTLLVLSESAGPLAPFIYPLF
jgi:hypothetical protein